MKRSLLGVALLACCGLATAAEPPITVVLPLEHAKATDLAKWIAAPDDQAVEGDREVQPFACPAGVTQLTGYDTIHALIARGTPAGIAELRELVRLLDAPAPHIRIEISDVWVPVATLTKLGMTWGLTDTSAKIQGRAAGSIALQFGTGREAEVRAILAMDPAVRITELEPLVLRQGQPGVVAWQQPVDAMMPDGWQLDGPLLVENQIVATARAAGSSRNLSVVLTLATQLSTLLGFTDTPDGIAAPIVGGVGDGLATLRVPNGGALVLAGFQSTERWANVADGEKPVPAERLLLVKATIVEDGPAAE